MRLNKIPLFFIFIGSALIFAGGLLGYVNVNSIWQTCANCSSLSGYPVGLGALLVAILGIVIFVIAFIMYLKSDISPILSILVIFILFLGYQYVTGTISSFGTILVVIGVISSLVITYLKLGNKEIYKSSKSSSANNRNSRKGYACNRCNYICDTAQEIKRHIMTVHSGGGMGLYKKLT